MAAYFLHPDSAPVMALIADRFLVLGFRLARDVATGLDVEFEVGDPPAASACATERELELSCPRLIAAGPCEGGRWFAARLRDGKWDAACRARSIDAARVVLSATLSGTAVGARLVLRPWVRQSDILATTSAMACLLRSQGVVAVHGRAMTPALFDELRHRHQALIVTGDDDVPPVVGWVRRLAGISPRAHVIVDLRAERPRVDRRREAVLRAAARETDRALACLQWGRDGSSARQGLGGETMAQLNEVTKLLQTVNDAEDEHAILVRACRWVKARPGCLGVAFVSAADGRPVATEGFSAADLGDADVAGAIDGPVSRVTVQGARAVVTTPVRHGGQRIGSIVARTTSQEVESLHEAVRTVALLCGSALRARLDAAALARAGAERLPEILGTSPSMDAVREAVARTAATAFPVLIEGASGTGKELIARAIHRLSARRDRTFCAVNCAALTDDLVEAELFGHARGAFTGAAGPRAGLFEEAHGGTLFLDEVAELSSRAQAKLLRVLQEREVRRLGENMPRRVDVRVVAATNRPLADEAAAGRFRDDLLFRLAVARIRVPALCDRVEDLPLLAAAFWRRAAVEAGTRAVLGGDAVSMLGRHAWPGNVRELQNVMAAIALGAPSRGRVTARHVLQALGGRTGADAVPQPLPRAKRHFERRAIAAALARHGGRRSAAARELGISRQGLTKAMRRVGLHANAGRVGVA